MRNPIRVKNLSLRLLPWYAVGALLLLQSEIAWQTFLLGLPWVLAGLALRAWGAGHLVKNERFTVSGPYAYVRHPLYLGTACIATGFALMLGGRVSIAALAVFALWFAASYYPRKERVEAERLRLRYGEAFERYRVEVPGLCPRPTRWQPGPALTEQLETNAPWRLARFDCNNEQGTALAVFATVTLLAACAALP